MYFHFSGEPPQKDPQAHKGHFIPLLFKWVLLHMQLNGSYIWMVLDYKGFYMQKKKKKKPLHKESGFYLYHCERIE